MASVGKRIKIIWFFFHFEWLLWQSKWRLFFCAYCVSFLIFTIIFIRKFDAKCCSRRFSFKISNNKSSFIEFDKQNSDKSFLFVYLPHSIRIDECQPLCYQHWTFVIAKTFVRFSRHWFFFTAFLLFLFLNLIWFLNERE